MSYYAKKLTRLYAKKKAKTQSPLWYPSNHWFCSRSKQKDQNQGVNNLHRYTTVLFGKTYAGMHIPGGPQQCGYSISLQTWQGTRPTADSHCLCCSLQEEQGIPDAATQSSTQPPSWDTWSRSISLAKDWWKANCEPLSFMTSNLAKCEQWMNAKSYFFILIFRDRYVQQQHRWERAVLIHFLHHSQGLTCILGYLCSAPS